LLFFLKHANHGSEDEVTGDWRKLHYEELHNLYSSPNIIRMMKSRTVGWAGHVARMGGEEECKTLYGFFFSPMLATYPANLILPDFIILIICDEVYEL
jgi:hypothetical protein